MGEKSLVILTRAFLERVVAVPLAAWEDTVTKTLGIVAVEVVVIVEVDMVKGVYTTTIKDIQEDMRTAAHLQHQVLRHPLLQQCQEQRARRKNRRRRKKNRLPLPLQNKRQRPLQQHQKRICLDLTVFRRLRPQPQ